MSGVGTAGAGAAGAGAAGAGAGAAGAGGGVDDGASVVDGGALAVFAEEVGADGPVAVVGGRTHWSIGGAVADGVRLVVAPAGVAGHEPAEMTVRVRAGTTLEELDAVLAPSGQAVALAGASGATVGGALSVGHSQITQLRDGPVRDALLEARYVSADGRLVKAGGPTVKNVSGYDLCRLLVGSLGTLGLLAEVVLRTRPRPPCSRWFSGVADPGGVRAALYRPSAVLWDGQRTWVCLEGHEVDVEVEGAVLAGMGITVVEGPPPLPAHRHRIDPAAVALLPDPPGSFVAEIGTGVVYRPEPALVPSVAAPVSELCRRIKAQFDPTGRLNPGRDPLTVMR